MAVQDDSRENEVIELLGLVKGNDRSGVDAFYSFIHKGKTITIDIELKSTTNSTVSTARDVGIDHIDKWRSKYWIIAFYSPSGKDLISILGLSPEEMDPWISSIEDYISPDYKISELASRKLTMEDLFEVCEQKPTYGTDDAKKLHKQQWNSQKYEYEKDVENGYSQEKMLEILRLRSKYISERGSTLNNPHITQSFINSYSGKIVTVDQIRTKKVKDKFLSEMAEAWLQHIGK
jgi:hypothetical protein